MAKQLRDEKVTGNLKGKGWEGRDPPPHMATNVGLQMNGEDLLGDEIYAISSFPTRWHSFPVTHSQAKNEPRKISMPEKDTNSDVRYKPLPLDVQQPPMQTEKFPQCLTLQLSTHKKAGNNKKQ